jgi:hypothetical protein
MDEYNILNSVKPIIHRPKYPYNLFDSKKIIKTQKKITILVKELESTTNQNEKNKPKQGGNSRTILFYG